MKRLTKKEIIEFLQENNVIDIPPINTKKDVFMRLYKQTLKNKSIKESQDIKNKEEDDGFVVVKKYSINEEDNNNDNDDNNSNRYGDRDKDKEANNNNINTIISKDNKEKIRKDIKHRIDTLSSNNKYKEYNNSSIPLNNNSMELEPENIKIKKISIASKQINNDNKNNINSYNKNTIDINNKEMIEISNIPKKEYLKDNYDFNILTVIELRKILLDNNIIINDNLTKKEYINIIKDKIIKNPTKEDKNVIRNINNKYNNRDNPFYEHNTINRRERSLSEGNKYNYNEIKKERINIKDSRIKNDILDRLNRSLTEDYNKSINNNNNINDKGIRDNNSINYNRDNNNITYTNPSSNNNNNTINNTSIYYYKKIIYLFISLLLLILLYKYNIINIIIYFIKSTILRIINIILYSIILLYNYIFKSKHIDTYKNIDNINNNNIYKDIKYMIERRRMEYDYNLNKNIGLSYNDIIDYIHSSIEDNTCDISDKSDKGDRNDESGRSDKSINDRSDKSINDNNTTNNNNTNNNNTTTNNIINDNIINDILDMVERDKDIMVEDNIYYYTGNVFILSIYFSYLYNLLFYYIFIPLILLIINYIFYVIYRHRRESRKEKDRVAYKYYKDIIDILQRRAIDSRRYGIKGYLKIIQIIDYLDTNEYSYNSNNNNNEYNYNGNITNNINIDIKSVWDRVCFYVNNNSNILKKSVMEEEERVSVWEWIGPILQ